MALLSEGSTTTQGKYATNIRRAVDYLVSRSRSQRPDRRPAHDDRYTYGHGYSMLFLSQVLGEEEDDDRRKELIDVLTKAVEFTGQAQTDAGGWGYVSAKDGSDFDEGSTTITQVQGLRGCRNAGIPVPKEIIDKAIKYIHKCTLARRRRAVQFQGRRRPAGHHRRRHRLPVQRRRLRRQVRPQAADVLPNAISANISNQGFGHWHYAHYYYSQVMYREGGEKWKAYRDKIYSQPGNRSQRPKAIWNQGYIGPVYTTAINLTILQLDNGSSADLSALNAKLSQQFDVRIRTPDSQLLTPDSELRTPNPRLLTR